MEISAFALAVAPSLLAIAENTVGDLLANSINGGDGDGKDPKLAVATALDVWLTSLAANFDAEGIPEEEAIVRFANAEAELARFLQDQEVRDQLMRPFTEETPEPMLDSTIMRLRWKELGLPSLPEEIEFRSVNRRYVRALNRDRQARSDLRSLFLAQRQSQAVEIMRGLRGHWPDFDPAQYAQRFRARYRALELSALTPPERETFDMSFALADVFVPQDAREAVPTRDIPKDYLKRLADDNFEPEELEAEVSKLRSPEAWDQAKRRSVRELLAEEASRRAVILGDPGAGKTTLARDLCLRALAMLESGAVSAEPWLEPFANRLPLIIELRLYVKEREEGRCQTFLEYLHYLGKSQGYGLNAVDLDSFLKTERSLIVFDGLDEVLAPQVRRKVIEEIIGFGHDYIDARILVTSRIHGYERGPLLEARFRHMTLDELSDHQIAAFTDSWFGLAFRDQPAEAERRCARVHEALEKSAAIKALARNPLVLTIIAIVARHRELPRDRAKLYEHALRVFVFHWEVTEKFDRELLAAPFLEDEDKIEMLRGIAWAMSERVQALAANVIAEDELEKLIEEYLHGRWSSEVPQPRSMARLLVQQLRERNFVLCLQGPDLFGFVHRTFLDYLVAQEILVQFEKERTLSEDGLLALAKSHAADEPWREILRLLCGMLTSSVAGQMIEAMIPGDHEEDIEDELYLGQIPIILVHSLWR